MLLILIKLFANVSEDSDKIGLDNDQAYQYQEFTICYIIYFKYYFSPSIYGRVNISSDVLKVDEGNLNSDNINSHCE